MKELEQQRDNLYAYTKDELKAEPPAVLETLRRQNDDLRLQQSSLQEDLAKARAELSSVKAASAPPPAPPPPPTAAGASASDARAIAEARQQAAQMMALYSLHTSCPVTYVTYVTCVTCIAGGADDGGVGRDAAAARVQGG